MRQPYTKTITGTSEFVAIEAQSESMKYAQIRASGTGVQIRRTGDESADGTNTLADGETVPFINIDLAQIEVHAPGSDKAVITASPH